MADLNVAGLISIIIFYLAILGIGLFAAWKKNKHSKQNSTTTQDETNEVILAGRTIGMFIGCFTMTGKCYFSRSPDAIILLTLFSFWFMIILRDLIIDMFLRVHFSDIHLV